MIVAVADNGVIGNEQGMPWHLSEDLKRFKALTLGHPVVMGRRTWDSLPVKPLPGRANIVVTREPGFAHDGAEAAPSLEDGYSRARVAAENAGCERIYLIGGASLYAQALEQAGPHRIDRIEVTRVHLTPEGNAHLAPFDPAVWEVTARESGVSAKGGIAYDFETLERRG